MCSESWLHDRHEDKYVDFFGYQVFRADRKHKGVSGVAVWIRNSIQVRRLRCDYSSLFECLILRFVTFGFVLAALYVPPETALRESDTVNHFIS